MTFAEWVQEQGYSWAQAGAAIGCGAAEAWHYANGRVPRRKNMMRIFKKTGGAVTPLDWYGVSADDLHNAAAESSEAA